MNRSAVVTWGTLMGPLIGLLPLVGLWFAVALGLSAGSLPAAEPQTWSVAARPLAEALADLAHASPASPGPGLSYAATTGPAGRVPVTCTLIAADPATQTQALAHAAGLWWCPTAAGPVLTAGPAVVRSAPQVRLHSSALLHDAEAERTVLMVLGPWLGTEPGNAAEGTISYDAEHGTWSAALDATGQARLVALLSLLQRPLPQAPDYVPPASGLMPSQPLQGELPAGDWGAWCAALATATGSSVSLAPEVVAGSGAPALVLTGTCDHLAELLATKGLKSRGIAQVLCIGRSRPQPRIHPALSAMLANLPMAHLLPTPEQGPVLAAALTPLLPANPGWGLRWLPASGSLLVVADPENIHRMLDALDQLDRLGFTAGLTALSSMESP
jgi:hypothetical protein